MRLASLNDDLAKRDLQGLEQYRKLDDQIPVLLAKDLFGSRWAGRRIISFVDYDAARFSFINSNSSSSTVSDMLLIDSALDARHGLGCWYERVPSESNIADAPSRMKLSDELVSLGAILDTPWGPEGAYKKVL